MKRVLVTGGAGFIGSNLALHLETLGIEVVVADYQLSTAETSLKGFRGQKIALDVATGVDISGPFDVVFHQAAITDPRHSNDAETYDKNTVGFRHITRFCQQKKARLVYASTAGLYGNGPIPMHEDQPKECITVYGRSKLAMDEQAQKLFSEMPIVGLRYFNVFGPRESHKGRPASMIYHLSRQIKKGGPARLFSYGEQVRDFIYVRDVVEANLRAIAAPSGVYNVGTGVGTTFNELVMVLNRVLGTNAGIEYFPMPYDPKTYQSNTVADTERAKQKLGFTATWELEPSVAEYMKWLDENEGG